MPWVERWGRKGEGWHENGVFALNRVINVPSSVGEGGYGG